MNDAASSCFLSHPGFIVSLRVNNTIGYLIDVSDYTDTNTNRNCMSTTDATVSVPQPLSALRRAVTAPLRLQTYRNLLYLLVAFPLGLAYFVGFVTGSTLGVGLLITWVGLPILLVTLTGATIVAGFEAWLATHLVGVNASVPAFLHDSTIRDGIALPGDGFRDAVSRLIIAPSTWTSLLLVLTKFGFGLLSFIALVMTGAIGVALLTAPFVYNSPTTLGSVSGTSMNQYQLGSLVIDTFPEAIAVAAGGVLFLLVAINILNAFARFQAHYTAALLQIKSDQN